MRSCPASSVILLFAVVRASYGIAGTPASQQFGCETPVILNANANVWKDYKLHSNIIYRETVTNAIEDITDPTEKARALHIAETGNFAWIERTYEIGRLGQLISDVPCNHILGLVLAGLPYRTCEAAGLPPFEDPWNYEKDFIAPITSRIKANPRTAFAVIIEPGILSAYSPGRNDSCIHLRDSWYRNIPKALKLLDLPNVITYLDGGNGGTFGWTGRPWEGTTSEPPKWFHQNEGTAIEGAKELTRTWEAAGPLKQFRGLAVNVRGYNSWDMSPGENFAGENTCYDLYNKARNEKRYLDYLLKQGLRKINSTMPFHNIIDTSRSGQAGIRENWSDWCNVKGARAGQRPSADTNDPNLDAFVWASGIGISDGTSDKSSTLYNAECGSKVSFAPMPERGDFSLEYFRMVLGGCKDCVKRKILPQLEKRCGQ